VHREYAIGQELAGVSIGGGTVIFGNETLTDQGGRLMVDPVCCLPRCLQASIRPNYPVSPYGVSTDKTSHLRVDPVARTCSGLRAAGNFADSSRLPDDEGTKKREDIDQAAAPDSTYTMKNKADKEWFDL